MDDKGVSGAARHAAFAPLEDGGRAEVVARRLGEAIALGLLGDGEQLPSEADLAAQLKVATVTLREALSSLRHHGLVETRRGRGGGSFARSPAEASLERLRKTLRERSVHELRETGDQHLAIAGTAALLAAERAGPDDVATLHRLVAQLESARTPGDRRRADGRFHIETAAAAQSSRLTRQEIALQAEIGELLWMPSGEAVAHKDAVADHLAILQAVEDGDGSRARSIVERHIGRGIDRLIEFHLRLAGA
ncbi:GntR family transcriptional regulator [Streptomyces abyssalis]|uniref:GntR family transcriptional regulator n=1 Tax=Streptomyces abyssalis TaxID=933944 RepID=A0A1E7JN71_9ACTN|nr:FCD domain-containing protein [Streptomyces abyssalis]OEU86889.1 GntR family transcriptional regulator [Streptomyces abyssalis]OEU89727.1 GntR family transcriptional regulator [Streptomyces abyssalis]OEV31337.1 GntR family transcriptional regulator [Streptomyces nanshensis]